MRVKQDYTGSNVNLRIYTKKTDDPFDDDDKIDYFFDNELGGVDEKHKRDGIKYIESKELSNRAKIRNLTVSCGLLVNGKRVAKTLDEHKVNWPNHYAEIFEQFQIRTFTMPASLQLEVFINGNLMDILNIEVPGEHVKSLTFATQLV